ALLGAGAALLMAPEDGRNARKRLSKRIEREKKQLARELDRQRQVLVKKGRAALDDAADYLSDELQGATKKIVRMVARYRRDPSHRGRARRRTGAGPHPLLRRGLRLPCYTPAVRAPVIGSRARPSPKALASAHCQDGHRTRERPRPRRASRHVTSVGGGMAG